MAKHFEIMIGENSLSFSRRQAEIDAEASLDGIYVIRTSVSDASASTPPELSGPTRASRWSSVTSAP